jgi:energy-converting hydrogenase Eha subunit C
MDPISVVMLCLIWMEVRKLRRAAEVYRALSPGGADE